jgi:hypothetical protein
MCHRLLSDRRVGSNRNRRLTAQKHVEVEDIAGLGLRAAGECFDLLLDCGVGGVVHNRRGAQGIGRHHGPGHRLQQVARVAVAMAELDLGAHRLALPAGSERRLPPRLLGPDAMLGRHLRWSAQWIEVLFDVSTVHSIQAVDTGWPPARFRATCILSV